MVSYTKYMSKQTSKNNDMKYNCSLTRSTDFIETRATNDLSSITTLSNYRTPGVKVRLL